MFDENMYVGLLLSFSPWLMVDKWLAEGWQMVESL